VVYRTSEEVRRCNGDCTAGSLIHSDRPPASSPVRVESFLAFGRGRRRESAMIVEVGPMADTEVESADRIFRLAFGTFLGLPDPVKAFGDADSIRTRRNARNTVALAARKDGVLVASNIITQWGSVGWFGPLTVRPDLWDQGIARALLDATLPVFEGWAVTHRGLFTFCHSPKHVTLYQRYGFWPRFLTPILEKPLTPDVQPSENSLASVMYSTLDRIRADLAMRECAELADGVFSGLDLSGEIQSVKDQAIGDTVLVYEESRIAGFAVCHVGARSEAGSGNAYIKFAVVRPGEGAPGRLDALLRAVEVFAVTSGAEGVEAGVNASHRDTLKLLWKRGFKIEFIGVAMHSPDEPAYHRPEVFVIDDWR
jgi:GNAT superfamily N-acetyltransferase